MRHYERSVAIYNTLDRRGLRSRDDMRVIKRFMVVNVFHGRH
jgi:hypothetical protein